MSDYLWDKTGEADDETKRLEELLGGLRFEPRPLELPALPARTLGAARTRSLLSWPRLAVAASLTAALLLGAWLLIAERRTTPSDAPRMARTETMGGEKDKYRPGQTLKDDKTPKQGDDKQPQSFDGPGDTPREGHTAKGPKPRRPDLVRGGETIRVSRVNRVELVKHRMPRVPPANPERRELTAQKFTREEIAAAEKVMYALRLTSEKLSYARQQVQDAGRREVNR